MPPSPVLSLTGVDRTIEAYLDQFQRTYGDSASFIHIGPANDFANALVPALVNRHGLGDVQRHADGWTLGCPTEREPAPGDQASPVHVVTEMDEDKLPAHLHGLRDLEAGRVLFPVSESDGKNHPLFLISIPKAGTHLLHELAQALGYAPGVVHGGDPHPGFWYCVEHSNTHTKAKDFFVDATRFNPHGNRLHLFASSPALFMYRHPHDILISEASYYHRPDASPFWGYLKNLSFEERIDRLIDDKWLLGTLADRVGAYVAWLDFPNVLPLSFEEMVGPGGGGDADKQRRAIWSLLLKLRLDGDVDGIANRLFNRDSPTFHMGQIGGHGSLLPAAAREKLLLQDQGHMERLGYAAGQFAAPYSSRVEEFRNRPFEIPTSRAQETPVLIEQDFHGWNLIRFRRCYYAIHIDEGPLDIGALHDADLARIINAPTARALKSKLLSLMCGMISEATSLRTLGAIQRNIETTIINSVIARTMGDGLEGQGGPTGPAPMDKMNEPGPRRMTTPSFWTRLVHRGKK